MIYMMSCKFWK